MKITKIEISNFRSIKDKISIESENINLLTLVGGNSSGKSNILRAVNLFFNGVIEPGKNYNPVVDLNQSNSTKRGRIYIELEFDSSNDRSMTTFLNKNHSSEFKDNKVPIALSLYTNGNMQYSFTVSGGQKKNLPELRQRILDYVNCIYIPAIKDYNTILNQQMLKKIVALTFHGWGKGRRGSKVIGEQKEKFQNLLGEIQNVLDESGNIASDIITEVVPAVDKFSFSLPYDNLEEFLGTVLFEVKEEHLSSSINLENVGSGVQSFTIFTMLKLLHELRPTNTYKKSKFIWLIEEPETFMHHDLQRMTKQKLSEYSNDGIIFLTSHSPVFVDKSNFNNSYVVYQDHMTKLNKISARNILKVLAGNLGLDIQDFLPFKRYNLLVEGDTDKKILTELYKLFKKDDPEWDIDLSELEYLVCGSANAIPHFYNVYNIFNQYSDLFGLFDRDPAGTKARTDMKKNGVDEKDLILIPESDFKQDNEIEDLCDKQVWDSILDYLDNKGLIVIKSSQGEKVDYEFEHRNRIKVKSEFAKKIIEEAKNDIGKFKKFKMIFNSIHQRIIEKNAT
jgi:predicted ATP-dependent endonuclease of OLD family